jgi:hypothetical protein
MIWVHDHTSSGILPRKILDKRLEARFYQRLSRLTKCHSAQIPNLPLFLVVFISLPR